MTYQNTYAIRGWNPEKKSWFSFLKHLLSEISNRLKQAISTKWIAEKVHCFTLERIGSQNVYSLIRASIDETLNSIDMNHVFKRENEILIRTQIKEKMKLLLYKERNGGHITAEFIIDNVSSLITTYQLTFINNEGTFGDLIEAVKYEQSKTGFGSGRLSSGNFPQITFKIIADLLKINIQPKNVRLLSASIENKQL